MADKFSYDVFLSHNHKDKPRVRRIAERLKQAGLRVWFDEWIIKPGEIIALKVDEGLEQARVLLLCISPNALASGWVALERSTAIHRDPSNQDRRFIPLLLEDCDLPDTLRRYMYLDLREESETTFQELLTACQPDVTALPQAKPKKTAKKRAKPQAKKPKQSEPFAVLENRIVGHRDWVRGLAFSLDGKWVVSTSGDAVKIWDLQKLECKATIATRNVWAVEITSDSQKIVYVDSEPGSAHVVDLESQREISVIKCQSLVSFALLQNDQQMLAGMSGGLKIWDLTSGESLRKFHDTGAMIWKTAASKDGRHAITAHLDGSICQWDLETGDFVILPDRHSAPARSIDITPDGRYGCSGSDDTTVKLWDLEKHVCIGTLEGHGGQVWSVKFSPDGRYIASTGYGDHTIRIWDRETAVCLDIIENEDQAVTVTLGFSPNGRRLFLGTSGGSYFYVYRLADRPHPQLVETARRYVNAKVVLLGEGTVGKTSLAHRLVEDKYVIRDRTHGMNVWQLDLPLAPDETLEREALLWDLAGQEDYRLIHQLFLDETALALLLVNPQKDDPFAEAGDWLKALKSAGVHSENSRDVNRLLIFSQIDVGGMKLGNAKIERFNEQHGFSDWLATSAKTGENCSDSENGDQPSRLKQLIASSIPWDKLPWTSTPRLLTELKKAVVAMRDKTDIRLMRFAELTQRLEQALPSEKFGEAEVRTAVTLLANHGLARTLKFGDLVLLQPELLNGYAGAIVRAARANKDEIGSVLEADIYDKNFDFTGVARLKQRADEELLLRALVQTFLDHSLCIAEDTPQGRQLVFPSQYRREKDIPRDPDIFVSYSFSGEWQTVWTTLVVRLWYSQEFGHKELWRNAAEFSSPKGFTLGLKIDNKQGEGLATISLYFDKEVPDDLKAIFIEFVHRHLAKYGCEVSRDRRYVCQNCGNPVTDLEAVRKRLEAKKDFITCQECDERVVLIDFIEQRLKSDPVARKIMAMDETATRGLDTQALEQILMGHMMAICGEANQIFRAVSVPESSLDAEVEFKDNDGKASGKKILVQLKSWNYYKRASKIDGNEVFEVKDPKQLEFLTSQPADVYLVVRQTDEALGAPTIRWMNVTRYLKDREDKKSRQIVFTGEKLDMEAVWKVRDQFFPPTAQRQK